MKKFFAVLVLGIFLTVQAQAADSKQKSKKQPSPPPPVAAAAPAIGESEAAKKWKDLEAQEQWVTRLKKQLEGELKQLSEMRGALAENFKLDAKKLENGAYEFDEKSDSFIEKKAP